MRTLALVDGEHYPPVTRWGLEVARRAGLRRGRRRARRGDREARAGETPDLGVPVAPRVTTGLGDRRGDRRPPSDVVLDLSDEPILGYRERMAVAAVALARGVPYVGPDFRLDPPTRAAPPLGTPTLAVFGTGKRTGKTAVAAEIARIAARRRCRRVVAMGRGGPPSRRSPRRAA
jgi:cyclic 2,3-diphosphoglycerate synthetase